MKINIFYNCLVLSLLASCAVVSPQSVSPCNGAETPSTRFLIQQLSASSAVIRWRGPADTICVGKDSATLDMAFDAIAESGHKQAMVTGLEPETAYYYSLGGAPSAAEGQVFHTAPPNGKVPEDGNTHIWILGDSGSATSMSGGKPKYPGHSLAVKEGFYNYNRAHAGNEALDLILLLGDNAYDEGSDEQWQKAFFDIYPELLKTTAVWSTIGNHEMGSDMSDACPYYPMPGCDKGPVMTRHGGTSKSSDPNSYDSTGDGPDPEGVPYLNIFSLPTNGSNGGIPSGTELYYSMDYANLHLVSLDSQLSNRDASKRAAMREWLIDDLSANKQNWTIVIFHHPPYSRGENHDSDLEQTEIDMRTQFTPVFEDYGVDVVYSGHSHAYERSWYLHGHQGPSESFDATLHAELDESGKAALGAADAPYQQVSPSSGSDDKAVYTVAGSAGKASIKKTCRPGQIKGCTLDNWLTHPAHRTFEGDSGSIRPNGLPILGSVVLDVSSDTLTSRFIDQEGNVRDSFTITRE